MTTDATHETEISRKLPTCQFVDGIQCHLPVGILETGVRAQQGVDQPLPLQAVVGKASFVRNPFFVDILEQDIMTYVHSPWSTIQIDTKSTALFRIAVY